MEHRQTEPGRCILCGTEAVSFGSRSIAAGWLCGECVGKMSPWFRCRHDITEAELRDHLAYREENKTRLPDFHPTVRLWKDPALYLDDTRRQFTVSDALLKELPTENPDILECRQILQCDAEIEEHRSELKKFSQGLGRISYRPRRYEYRFNIWVRILVEHPFFHEMRFCLNRRPLIVKGYDVEASVQGKVVKNGEYQSCVRAAEKMREVLLQARDAALTGEENGQERNLAR
ncbi:MAG: hypothetical protein IJK52_07080 [Oscillospiraceae bacterium]|nr:hypothetical protein [Oscillospiraceae bacterium]